MTTTTDKIIDGWMEAKKELERAIVWAETNRQKIDSMKCSDYVMAGSGYPWATIDPNNPRLAAKTIGGQWIDQGSEWELKGPIRLRIRTGKIPPSSDERLVNLEEAV